MNKLPQVIHEDGVPPGLHRDAYRTPEDASIPVDKRNRLVKSEDAFRLLVGPFRADNQTFVRNGTARCTVCFKPFNFNLLYDLPAPKTCSRVCDDRLHIVEPPMTPAGQRMTQAVMTKKLLERNSAVTAYSALQTKMRMAEHLNSRPVSEWGKNEYGAYKHLQEQALPRQVMATLAVTDEGGWPTDGRDANGKQLDAVRSTARTLTLDEELGL